MSPPKKAPEGTQLSQLGQLRAYRWKPLLKLNDASLARRMDAARGTCRHRTGGRGQIDRQIIDKRMYYLDNIICKDNYLMHRAWLGVLAWVAGPGFLPRGDWPVEDVCT
jgi:hypothetical protein